MLPCLLRWRLNRHVRRHQKLPITWAGDWQVAYTCKAAIPGMPAWGDFCPNGNIVAIARVGASWVIVSWYAENDRVFGGLVFTGKLGARLAKRRFAIVFHQADPRVNGIVPADHFLWDDAVVPIPA